ncbi:AhpC/TSA family protein [Chitinophaga niastensis]|uniref:AhpC/TSA family protein n=1 Tax=Chitinophaga niastensis TaxID=536980 RepID=A0A2P8HPR9_CHINA|nr:redoxin domain-containing protein [Chitinophaga niastensis]PSL48205.1 AhpC/TSA family protein [Chitinophaga niastensis]
MKKVLFCALIFCVTICACNKKSDIPVFNLLLLDSTTKLSTSKIPDGKPVMIMFISPDCEHCEEQTTDLLKNMDSLKSVQFYFVSIDPIDRLKAFNKDHKLADYPNITLGRDYTFSFPKYFEVNTAPFSALYDKHKQLKLVIKGGFKVSQIMAEVNKL